MSWPRTFGNVTGATVPGPLKVLTNPSAVLLYVLMVLLFLPAVPPLHFPFFGTMAKALRPGQAVFLLNERGSDVNATDSVSCKPCGCPTKYLNQTFPRLFLVYVEQRRSLYEDIPCIFFPTKNLRIRLVLSPLSFHFNCPT